MRVDEEGKVFIGKQEITESGTELFSKRLIQKAKIYVNGKEKYAVNDRYINKEWIDENGFTEPIFYPAGNTPNGLGNKKCFIFGKHVLEIRNYEKMTLDYVREELGDDFTIPYFDCQTQKQFRTTLLRYFNYYTDSEITEDGSKARYLQNRLLNKRFNVISIEFSNESLAQQVDIPLLYTRISWQSLVPEDSAMQPKYETPPKMGKYLLIGNLNFDNKILSSFRPREFVHRLAYRHGGILGMVPHRIWWQAFYPG